MRKINRPIIITIKLPYGVYHYIRRLGNAIIGKPYKQWKGDICDIILEEVLDQLPYYHLYGHPMGFEREEWLKIKDEILDLAKRIKEGSKIKFTGKKLQEQEGMTSEDIVKYEKRFAELIGKYLRYLWD